MASTTCRCTAGSVRRRRSGRGGKSPARTPRPAVLLARAPLLPDQEAVAQHHRDRMTMEGGVASALKLVPAEELFCLLVVLLDPVPPVGILHQSGER